MGGKRPVSAARKGPVGDDVNDPSRPKGKGGQRGSVEMVDSGNMMKVQSSGPFPQPDKEGTVLDLESVVPRKSAAVSLACSMQSESEGASNMEGAKGGVEVEDGGTHERFVDEESGDSFFVHRVSGKSVWENPEEKKE